MNRTLKRILRTIKDFIDMLFPPGGGGGGHPQGAGA